MSVKLVWVTPYAEQVIGHCARVSSPENQGKDSVGLLKYCIRNQHWSIFEMANMCVEIETGRDISAHLLRHRSFTFQEFSQRYSKVDTYQVREARRQDSKNRQNSIDDLSNEDKRWFLDTQREVWGTAHDLYTQALEKGIAKECARSLLPMSSTTRVYMNGTIRSWIHYLQLRTGNGTQKEHKDIANSIKNLFVEEFPVIASALDFRSNL